MSTHLIFRNDGYDSNVERTLFAAYSGSADLGEAITTARMARELLGTGWIKLEVIGHADTLQPDPFGLLEATEALSAQGFEVFPYTTRQVLATAFLRREPETIPADFPWSTTGKTALS